MPDLGFSTGALSATNLPMNDRIKFVRDLGCRAIEIGYARKERFFTEPLKEIDLKILGSFDWVSVHAPGSRWKCQNDEESQMVIREISAFHKRHRVSLVVFHPDSLVDPKMLDDAGFPIGIENMDPNKPSFQRPEDLMPLLQKFPAWRFVLDFNHCYVNDPTQKLADEMLRALGDRLAEKHISGYGDETKLHIPLYETRQDTILSEASRSPSAPMIIESMCADLVGAEKEYEYIKKHLDAQNVGI